MYGCHEDTVRLWIRTGKLAALRINSEYRITTTALEAFEQENSRSRCFAEDATEASS
jgi:excisionase family DNA binding protein